MNIKDKDIDQLIDDALKEDLTLPEGLSERLEQAIDLAARQETGEREKGKKNLNARSYWLYAISSAAAALIAALFLIFDEPARPIHLTDTYNDPHEAAIAAQHALALISTNLNKGLQKADEAQKEFQNAQQIIKKQLDK